MITKIELMHERRNFFDAIEQVTETREYNIERKHLLKAFRYMLSNAHDMPYVHIDVDGGTSNGGEHHVIFQEWGQTGTDKVTWITYSDTYRIGNIATDRREVEYKVIRKESRKWMEGQE